MGLPKSCGLILHHRHPAGPSNSICDIAGVSVGHVTLHDAQKQIHTGVTAILPHQGSLFQEKVPAGAAVINGFGKTAGLLQLEELGTIETPILLTNTLSVGTAVTASIRHALRFNPDIGLTTGTVNPLVCECNDGRINHIRGLHITEDHVLRAIENAAEAGQHAACAPVSGAEAKTEGFAEGAVGAGSGMVCLGLKGGIGTASRQLTIDGKEYCIGALVLTNFGAAGNLVIGGQHVDTRAARKDTGTADRDTGTADTAADLRDTGSIIIILATDIPLSERQLKRTARRSAVALGRTGSICGTGSGDIAIAFTTATRVPHYSDTSILPVQMFFDDHIDPVFEAAVESVEEAIISSLWHAETTIGRDGRTWMGLQDFLKVHPL